MVGNEPSEDMASSRSSTSYISSYGGATVGKYGNFAMRACIADFCNPDMEWLGGKAELMSGRAQADNALRAKM